MSINFKHPKLRIRITDLDENLTIEILSHLPYKYVMVSKSVCKLWNSLISTPYFVRRFLGHRLRITDSSEMEKEQPWMFMYSSSDLKFSKSTPKFTSRHSIFSSPGFSLSFVQPKKLQAICVVRTFNDLVLCCGDEFKQRTYYICNPITKQYVALPPAPSRSNSPSISNRKTDPFVDFICEPYYQKHHHQNEDIDVILNTQYRFWVMQAEKFITCQLKPIQTFSSETGKWDEYTVSIPDGFAEFSRYSYCVKSFSFHGNNLLVTIIEFNHLHVRPCMINMSYPNHNPKIKDQLRPLRRFALMPKLGFYQTSSIKIWELDENDFEWNLVDRVYLSEIVSHIDVSEHFLKMVEEEDVWVIAKVHGLDPHNQNVMYLNIEDIGMVKFDTQSRTSALLPNHHVDFFNDYDMDFFQIVVPFWPTPMPQISFC